MAVLVLPRHLFAPVGAWEERCGITLWPETRDYAYAIAPDFLTLEKICTH
ncbi:hypothetical protein SAMN05216252_106425 [Actinacidiphila glaucinigra]|uniref:Uncharacterized protein n=1 Tax=Actinacidiphila glaucinigra TaxID=235986 RepID=A0A239FD75_9ACTN|nr:hypothetical protein SAMN05216252_106425 [Actinacidiphila glaucinigra]